MAPAAAQDTLTPPGRQADLIRLTRNSPIYSEKRRVSRSERAPAADFGGRLLATSHSRSAELKGLRFFN